MAKRFQAHLEVVFTFERAEMPPAAVGRAMSLEFLELMSEEMNAHVSDVMAQCDESCHDLPSWQWHMGSLASTKPLSATPTSPT